MHAAKATGKTGSLTLHYFTLIELLVAAAIIALLAAMLLPALGRGREQAYRVVCMNNLKPMAVGFSLYGYEHEELLPGGNTGGAHNFTSFWIWWLYPYAANTELPDPKLSGVRPPHWIHWRNTLPPIVRPVATTTRLLTAASYYRKSTAARGGPVHQQHATG